MADLNPDMFREYDIRGTAGKDLTTEAAELIGKAFGTIIQPISGKKVVVGADNRLSSPELKKALIRGLVQTGCEVTDIGTSSTPMLYFAVCNYEFDGGINVTGSHLSKEYNGFKFTAKKAEPIYGMEIDDMHEMIEKEKFHKGRGSIKNLDILSAYLEMLAEKIQLNKNRKLKVVIDCMNGTASIMANKYLQDLGCEVTPIACVSDGSYPDRQPDPTKPEYLQKLIAEVKRQNADLGIAFDGDADRAGIVDNKGTVIWGDELMVVFVREILEKHPQSKILFEVKCSQALYDEIESLGGKPIFWKTGHSLIKAKMKQEKAIFAGEMSGHIFFADEFYGYDDAMYAAGRLLRILSNSDQSLSEMVSSVSGKYSTSPEYRVGCADNIKFVIVEQIIEHFLKFYPHSITVDGIRISFPDGWALVRASNTSPKLILRFESYTPEGLERIKRIVLKKLKTFPKVDLGELAGEVS